MQLCPLSHISYQLKRSARRQSLALQVKNGELWVLAPIGLSQLCIEQFIFAKKQWVLKHLAVSQPQPVPSYIEQQQLPFLAEKLQLLTVLDSHNAVTRQGQQLWVQLSRRVKPQNRALWQQQLIVQWYQLQALDWFQQRVHFWQSQMNVSAKAVLIGDWQRKWGSCNSKGEVSFNWRLLLAPPWVADYVVVHELAHLRHLDHSKNFWQMVAQFYPEYARVKQWLRAHQHQLVLVPAQQLLWPSK
jgi:predicted metal-dependent hydrolase